MQVATGNTIRNIAATSAIETKAPASVTAAVAGRMVGETIAAAKVTEVAIGTAWVVTEAGIAAEIVPAAATGLVVAIGAETGAAIATTSGAAIGAAIATDSPAIVKRTVRAPQTAPALLMALVAATATWIAAGPVLRKCSMAVAAIALVAAVAAGAVSVAAPGAAAEPVAAAGAADGVKEIKT